MSGVVLAPVCNLDNYLSAPISYGPVSDYYRILGVSGCANAGEIHRAYWKLARQMLDAGDAADIRLRVIRRAYYTLGDSERRREYDTTLRGAIEITNTPNATGCLGRDDLLPDEIAVDFPSMANVVERMRASFFGVEGGEDGSIHRTEVELTACQADRGARVPIDFLVRHTCPICGGRGEMWPETCGICRGTGAGLLRHQLQLQVPPGVRHGTRLRVSVTPPHAPETHVEVRIAIQ